MVQGITNNSNWREITLYKTSDIYIYFFFAVALRPNAGHGLLILEVF